MIEWFEKHRKLSWIITLVIAFSIFYLSGLSFKVLENAKQQGWMSIAYHFSVFFILSLFFFISLINKNNKHLFVFSILILGAYSILDEIHQAFVPGRFCSIGDVEIDLIGILFAFLIYLFSLEFRKIMVNQQKL